MLRSFKATNNATQESRVFKIFDSFTEQIKVHDIKGLDPSDATVLTAPYAYDDGSAYVGTFVEGRNIVLTLKLDPNYSGSIQTLRNQMYLLFQQHSQITLDFTTDDALDPVIGIEGYVDKIEAAMFTQEPLIQISIICADSYFVSRSPADIIYFTGTSLAPNYTGDIRGTAPTPYELQLTKATGKTLNEVHITFRNGLVNEETMAVQALGITAPGFISFKNIPRKRSFLMLDPSGIPITNLLNYLQAATSDWPLLIPKKQAIFAYTVYTDSTINRSWALIYNPRFVGV